jgi:hypothetical protein
VEPAAEPAPPTQPPPEPEPARPSRDLVDPFGGLLPAPSEQGAEPGAFGLLNIQAADPGMVAAVRIDGHEVGDTPLLRFRVPVGSHLIEVWGRACTPQTAVVRKNEVVNVTCR